LTSVHRRRASIGHRPLSHPSHLHNGSYINSSPHLSYHDFDHINDSHPILSSSRATSHPALLLPQTLLRHVIPSACPISLPTPVSPYSTQTTLPQSRPSISVVAAQCISSQPRIERALIPIDMQKILNMSLRWVLYTYIVRLIDLSCPDNSLPSFARIR
jgi:hypothetical protein